MKFNNASMTISCLAPGVNEFKKTIMNVRKGINKRGALVRNMCYLYDGTHKG